MQKLQKIVNKGSRGSNVRVIFLHHPLFQHRLKSMRRYLLITGVYYYSRLFSLVNVTCEAVIKQSKVWQRYVCMQKCAPDFHFYLHVWFHDIKNTTLRYNKEVSSFSLWEMQVEFLFYCHNFTNFLHNEFSHKKVIFYVKVEIVIWFRLIILT